MLCGGGEGGEAPVANDSRRRNSTERTMANGKKEGRPVLEGKRPEDELLRFEGRGERAGDRSFRSWRGGEKIFKRGEGGRFAGLGERLYASRALREGLLYVSPPRAGKEPDRGTGREKGKRAYSLCSGEKKSKFFLPVGTAGCLREFFVFRKGERKSTSAGRKESD